MIKKYSYFKHPNEDKERMINWVAKLEATNGYTYEKIAIDTSLGNTQVYALNSGQIHWETLVIFPGYRTTALIWDLDRGLAPLSKRMRIFLVETNGQPNLSEGNSPDIKSLNYGKWAAELLQYLEIESAYLAGASFGSLICMKLALVAPEKIKGTFLLSPSCFRMISLGLKNLYFNLLPAISPTPKNIQAFLDHVVFHKPHHSLSREGELLLIEYLVLALSKYKDHTEKPYYMKGELDSISVDTFIMVGNKDILFPPQKSLENAKRHLTKSLIEIQVFEDAGHGLECYGPSIAYIMSKI